MADLYDDEEMDEDLAMVLTMFFSMVDASEKKVGVLNLSLRHDVSRAPEFLLTSLKSRDQVVELNLSRCQLNVSSAVRILEATVKSHALRVIDLSYNGIEDIQPLIPLLQANSVQQVILTGNPCVKKEDDMAQLEALLETKRFIEPLALRCLRVFLVSPRADPPPWLFRWLFTEKKDWWHRLMFHRDPATRKGMERFVMHFLKHSAEIERPQYVYSSGIVNEAALAPLGSPHAPPPTAQTTQTLQYIDFHLSMLEITRYYWKYFGEYFNIVAQFCLLGPKERLYLIRRGMLFWFLDWYMGGYSPYRPGANRARVGSNSEPAVLTSFFTALTALIRSVRMTGIEKLGPTCFPDDVLEEMPTMAEASLELLWKEEVVYSMMRQGYNNDAVCQLIEHICWSSSERTKWVAMNIFQRFIARVGNLRDHIANAKFGIVRFLSIKDELREERAKMLLEVIPDQNFESKMPFFHFSVLANRRELDDIAPRLQLLMDVLSEDLPELQHLVKETGMRFINEVRTEGLPRIEEDHTAELIQQLEVLEILCETKNEKPAE